MLTVGSLLTVAIINMVSYGPGQQAPAGLCAKDTISWRKDSITFDLGNPDSRIPVLLPEQLHLVWFLHSSASVRSPGQASGSSPFKGGLEACSRYMLGASSSFPPALGHIFLSKE